MSIRSPLFSDIVIISGANGLPPGQGRGMSTEWVFPLNRKRGCGTAEGGGVRRDAVLGGSTAPSGCSAGSGMCRGGEASDSLGDRGVDCEEGDKRGCQVDEGLSELVVQGKEDVSDGIEVNRMSLSVGREDVMVLVWTGCSEVKGKTE